MKKSFMFFFTVTMGLSLILGSFPVVHAQETSSDEFTLEEITVTAEKRSVDIQKTALAVTAVSGADIADKAVSNISDLLDSLAAVKVMSGPMGGKIFIRGIGSNLDTNLASPSVALQKDSVYMGQSEAVMGSLYDIERVEVLYGPQGTMYGKNAAGGQVNIITKSPSDKFETSGGLSLGSYKLANYNAALNVPLSSKWAARLAIDQQNHDAYIDDGSGTSNKFGSRIKLSYKPTDKLSILLTTEYTSDKSVNMNTVPVPGSAGKLPVTMGPPPSFGWTVPDANLDGVADDLLDANGNTVAGGNGIPDIVDTGWEQVTSGDPWSNDIYHPAPKNNSTYETASMQVDWDMGFSKLTLIPTYNKNKRILWSNMFEGISRGGDLQEQSFSESQLTAEARLANSDDSKLIWTVGAYWYKSENKEINGVTTDLLVQAATTWESGSSGRDGTVAPHTSDNVYTANYRSPQDSLSAFGQATFPVTDKFRLTGGIRWNGDNNNLKYRIVIYDVSATGKYAASYYDQTTEIDGRHQYDSGLIKETIKSSPITYKAGFEYDLDTNKMLYSSYTTGYKNGGLNIQGVTPPTAYDPEEVDSYSLGIKSRFMDNRFQLNAEAYYYDYTGYQVQSEVKGVYDPIRGTTQNPMIVVNADKGTNAGLEISTDWMMTANDRLTTTVAYMKTKLGHIVLPVSPWSTSPMDLTGTDLPKAPHFSGTLGYEHTFNLDDGGTITPKFDTKLSGGFWNTHEKFLAGSYTDSYMMSDFYLTYAASSGRYNVALWIKNLENAAVTDYVYPLYRRVLMEPRTSGITFNVKF